jgi:hypothetical protein
VSSFEALVRRARDRARRLSIGLSLIGRWPVALALLAGLLASALGPPAPARADPPDPATRAASPDPAARIQVVIQGLYIYDDEDWLGAGELRMSAWVCSAVSPGACKDENPIVVIHDAIAASSGDTVTLNRVMPSEGDDVRKGGSAELGIPVYRGEQYALRVSIYDADFDPQQLGDPLGEVSIPIDEAHNWGIGSTSIRSTAGDGSAGDFGLFYEIRRAPLANLRMANYQVAGSPGSEYVCGQILNDGPKPAGPFGLKLSTEGQTLNEPTFPGLDAGASTWQCTLRSDLPARKHNLVFSIDEAHQVPEMEEYDNVGVFTVEADPSGTASPGAAPVSGAPAAAPSPRPEPTGAQPTSGQAGPSGDKPDLTAKAIRVNGQAPDGKNACRDGKNDLTVVVKNAGKADAGRFGVRLSVDGDGLDQTVESVRAGEEREVSFENVPLRKGEHKLTASVDASGAVDEARDGNNDLKVTVRCQG